MNYLYVLAGAACAIMGMLVGGQIAGRVDERRGKEEEEK